MGRVDSTALAGNVVRRVREDRGMSRAELSSLTGVSPRALYALEVGESENFGLGNYLRILTALGMSLSVDLDKGEAASRPSRERSSAPLPWDDLDDRWKLGEGSGQ